MLILLKSPGEHVVIFYSNNVSYDMITAYMYSKMEHSQITKFMGPTWGPPGSCRPQMVPMLAPWTLPSGFLPSVVRGSCLEDPFDRTNPGWNLRHHRRAISARWGVGLHRSKRWTCASIDPVGCREVWTGRGQLDPGGSSSGRYIPYHHLWGDTYRN